MSDHFTPKEVVNVIDEALRLIATPETFVQGDWKCQLYERDARGYVKEDDDGAAIPKTGKKGEQLYGYCVEGAINQAVLNLFGQERAVKVGAIAVDPYTEKIDFGMSGAACRLSVNATAHELYDDELRELYGYIYDGDAASDPANHSFARALNDDTKVDKETAYKRVKRILQRRRKEALSEI